MKIQERIVVNEKGTPVSVILNVRDYGKLLSLLADVVDSKYLAHHRKDSKRPFADFMSELRKKDLV